MVHPQGGREAVTQSRIRTSLHVIPPPQNSAGPKDQQTSAEVRLSSLRVVLEGLPGMERRSYSPSRSLR